MKELKGVIISPNGATDITVGSEITFVSLSGTNLLHDNYVVNKFESGFVISYDYGPTVYDTSSYD